MSGGSCQEIVEELSGDIRGAVRKRREVSGKRIREYMIFQHAVRELKLSCCWRREVGYQI
jgi:hypothetical protein